MLSGLMAEVLKGSIDGKGRRIAIAVGRFNDLINDRLVAGAQDALIRHGVADEDIQIAWVPGAFELPLTARWLAESGKFDAVLALGTVIRGATTHYDYVCNQAARGILDAAVSNSIPVAFGVLTCETLDQALERAGSKAGNKGADAAMAALEMIGVKDAIAGL